MDSMSEKSSNSSALYAVVLAGGSGTRFWPLSRNDRPKQLLDLFDDLTLLEKAVNRLDGLIPKERILILTNVAQEAAIRELMSDLPAGNIVAEPAKRDTAPAIALGAGWIAARDPEATMIVLPADQLVTDEAGFRDTLAAAAEAAQCSGGVVTLGITPSWACPSYGYIERGEVAQIDGYENPISVNEVLRFREKPSPEVAEDYVAQGNFVWNAGIFIWTLDTLTRELSQHCPDLAQFITDLGESENFDKLVADQFGALTKISIDYALMEKAARVLNIEAEFGWDDVGSWISVGKYLDKDESDNAVAGTVTALDSGKNIVYAKTGAHIALLGVENLIVVQTGDSILIADRDKADDIKRLVDILPKDLL